MKRFLAICVVALAAGVAGAGSASATIHPIVESFDCANQRAFDRHPLGDVADPPGQTPGYGSHSPTSSLRAVTVITDGLTDFSSPAVLGHKLDGVCGHAGG